MTIPIGVLCAGEGAELAALVAAVERGRLPARIAVVLADSGGPALALAREAGLYAALIPRAAFHANRDGFERRLVEMLRQAGAEAVVLAGFTRELGGVLTGAFPGAVWGRDLGPEELAADLEKRLSARASEV